MKIRLVRFILLLELVLMSAASGAGAAGSGVEWRSDYLEGMGFAQKHGLPALLLFTSESCPWCKVMQRDTFPDAAVQKILKGFVCITIDVHDQPETAVAFQVMSLPRVLLINSAGRITADRLGYLSAPEFVDWVKAAEKLSDGETAGYPVAPGLEALAVLDAIPEVEPLDKNRQVFSDEFLELLGHSEAAIRTRARETVRYGGDRMLEPLIDALGHSYLGVRISAASLLMELADNDLQFDPWERQTDRVARQKLWRQWLRSRSSGKDDEESEQHNGGAP